MNKTKRKIFETSMRLFAEKGYDATSIEDITETVGVAKGTLYYHFTSKEEIFDFLIEEGIKLLQNSVDIKTAKYSNYLDKIKAIVLIQIKIVNKYENLINRMGDNMMLKYGDAFTSENLRIMEAEYVTLNARLDGKHKEKNNITT